MLVHKLEWPSDLRPPNTLRSLRDALALHARFLVLEVEVQSHAGREEEADGKEGNGLVASQKSVGEAKEACYIATWWGGKGASKGDKAYADHVAGSGLLDGFRRRAAGRGRDGAAGGKEQRA